MSQGPDYKGCSLERAEYEDRGELGWRETIHCGCGAVVRGHSWEEAGRLYDQHLAYALTTTEAMPMKRIVELIAERNAAEPEQLLPVNCELCGAAVEARVYNPALEIPRCDRHHPQSPTYEGELT